ncbi:hypothetical protein [Xinfangfangia pollutisoli]|uniref:hypothetical protein n=1 Tax=Xinfangfangia pollutisoli TaxID=2865960 RepID=UPI001CD230EC|nr:hypothetical protein [Xinfangfangia pollutisoli]
MLLAGPLVRGPLRVLLRAFLLVLPARRTLGLPMRIAHLGLPRITGLVSGRVFGVSHLFSSDLSLVT